MYACGSINFRLLGRPFGKLLILLTVTFPCSFFDTLNLQKVKVIFLITDRKEVCPLKLRDVLLSEGSRRLHVWRISFQGVACFISHLTSCSDNTTCDFVFENLDIQVSVITEISWR
jgi:hypothetical protein